MGSVGQQGDCMSRNSWSFAVITLVIGLTGPGCSGGGQANVVYPDSQQAFYSLNKQCYQSYSGGQNEIQKSLAFNQCNNERLKFSQHQKISGWVGEITDISTDQGADVVSVTIRATIDGFGVSFGTVTNRVSDYATDSMVTPANPLFNILANMKEGEVVAFDAVFLNHPEIDRGLWESSLTEQGSVDEPEFLVRFTRIESYIPKSASPATTTMHQPNQEHEANESLIVDDRRELSNGQEPIVDATVDQEETVGMEEPRIGQMDEQFGYLLHREFIEGPYFNDWYGKPNGEGKILIEAQGKTMFSATLVVSCEPFRSVKWDGLEADESVDDVPGAVVKSAMSMACTILKDDVKADLSELVGKTLAEGKGILRTKDYTPESVSSNDFPHEVDGDSAYCGNAGCSLPWTRRDGSVRLCVSVEVSDDKEQSNLLITEIQPETCSVVDR